MYFESTDCYLLMVFWEMIIECTWLFAKEYSFIAGTFCTEWVILDICDGFTDFIFDLVFSEMNLVN